MYPGNVRSDKFSKVSECNSPHQQIKNTKHMIISKDTEKTFVKIQQLLDSKGEEEEKKRH